MPCRDIFVCVSEQLEFGKRYEIIKPDVIASQFNDEGTELITDHDIALPIGTKFITGDRFQWTPYSGVLSDQSINPYFYDIHLDSEIVGFESTRVAVLAHSLEQSVEELDQ